MNNQTSKVIYKMLTESTGKHFLDSGGENGRNWQRNQKKSFKDLTQETVKAFLIDSKKSKFLIK